MNYRNGASEAAPRLSPQRTQPLRACAASMLDFIAAKLNVLYNGLNSAEGWDIVTGGQKSKKTPDPDPDNSTAGASTGATSFQDLAKKTRDYPKTAFAAGAAAAAGVAAAAVLGTRGKTGLTLNRALDPAAARGKAFQRRVENLRKKYPEMIGSETAVTAGVTKTVLFGRVRQIFDAQQFIDIDRVSETYGMSKRQLAETAGLATATLSKADRRSGRKTQNRMREMIEILDRIEAWAGGAVPAMAWYRSQAIPALDGRTPEALVKDGRAVAVRDYLDHLALGGYA